MIDEREARLTQWRRLGRGEGQAFAVEAARGLKAGGTPEVWARALAEATLEYAGEYFRAGATRDELRAYVNELLASFGETLGDGQAG